jgi:phosphate-selective porin OprO/OprP
MNSIFKKTALALATAATFGAGPVLAAEVDTKGGIKVKSDDGQFVGELGGRMHLDAVFFENDDEPTAPDNDNDVYFRRLRLQAKGTMYGVWEGMIQVDFRNDGAQGGSDRVDTRLRDAYLAYSGFQFGKVSVGHMKIPQGLEELTSSNSLMFIERPAPLNAVTAGAYRQGLQVTGQTGNFSWQTMAYDANNRVAADGAADTGAGFGLAGRATWTPIKDKTKLLHLGVSMAKELDVQGLNDPTSNYELNNANTVVLANFDAAAQDDDELVKTGFEAAFVTGPLTLVAEYFDADLDSEAAGDPNYGGYYVAASYFLTGESRPYRASNGIFDRLKPNDKKGAWEIAARHSKTTGEVTDQTDREIETTTLGVNYYFNPQVRAMVNLVSADIDLGTGTDFTQKALVSRIQFDF